MKKITIIVIIILAWLDTHGQVYKYKTYERALVSTNEKVETTRFHVLVVLDLTNMSLDIYLTDPIHIDIVNAHLNNENNANVSMLGIDELGRKVIIEFVMFKSDNNSNDTKLSYYEALQNAYKTADSEYMNMSLSWPTVYNFWVGYKMKAIIN